MSLDDKNLFRRTRLSALQNVFPELFDEGVPDMARLIEELSLLDEGTSESPCLHWAGKAQAKSQVHAPAHGRLVPDSNSVSTLNETEHVLIEGDNLEVLKALKSTHFEQIKLMYIDPPYNTGKGFIYNDSFDAKSTASDKKKDSNSTWLSFIYPRLMAAKRLLALDGVIFVSIDDNSFGHLKIVMDEIFGADNCITTFVWRRSGAGGLRGKFPVTIHEYVLCYSKDKSKHEQRWYAPYSKDSVAAFAHQDERGRYKTQALYLSTLKSGENQRYPIRLPNGTAALPPDGGVWRFIESTFHQKRMAGEILFRKTPNSPLLLETGHQSAFNIYTKQYMDIKGSNPPSMLPDDLVGQTRSAKSEIKKIFNAPVFDYPKPVSLIKYLIGLVPFEDDDICMDFFAGSGTTLHAVVELNQSNSKRLRSISVQSADPIPQSHVAYQEGFRVISEITAARFNSVLSGASGFSKWKYIQSDGS
ncbi:MAG: site-specific DNA-methyltransferase [Myxococcota bacterium]